MHFRFLGVSLLLFVTMVAARPASATCSKASLKGTFGLSYGWPQALYDGTQGFAVGQITFDGKGSFRGSETGSGSATMSSFTGTYTLSGNCTGTFTFMGGVYSPAPNYNFYLDKSGNGFQLLTTDQNYIIPGFGTAQGDITCGLTGTTQSWAVNLVGTAFSSQNIAIVGQWKLNGKGKIGGSETTDINFSPTIGSVTGTYTENADCTGTMSVTQSGSSARNFNTVKVNGGNELLLIETDASTIMAGTAQ